MNKTLTTLGTLLLAGSLHAQKMPGEITYVQDAGWQPYTLHWRLVDTDFGKKGELAIETNGQRIVLHDVGYLNDGSPVGFTYDGDEYKLITDDRQQHMVVTRAWHGLVMELHKVQG
jgi:hypothetical protein